MAQNRNLKSLLASTWFKSRRGGDKITDKESSRISGRTGEDKAGSQGRDENEEGET